MARGGGIALALKSLQLFLRFIQWSCAAIILGIFSYYLATLHNHGLSIATYIRAVEGIAGAGTLYTMLALIFVCCLGGIAFLSLFAMLLDLAFAGAFSYVAWACRGGAGSCKGNVNTPFGSGDTKTNNRVSGANSGFTTLPSLRTACKLETACFAVAIVAAVFFVLSIPIELALIRHHRKERAFGPSPNNGYTAGSPKRKFWQRQSKQDTAYTGDKVNPNALPLHATPADVRTSYATESTAVGAIEPGYGPKYSSGHGLQGAGGAAVVGQGVGAAHGYREPETLGHGEAGGYYTSPHGTAVSNDGYNDGYGGEGAVGAGAHAHGYGARNSNPTGTF